TSINHKFPSGPATILPGLLLAVGSGNSVITPLGVMRPILLAVVSVNHKLPSGPAAVVTRPPLAGGGTNTFRVIAFAGSENIDRTKRMVSASFTTDLEN